MCGMYYIDLIKHEALIKIVRDFEGEFVPGKLAPVVLFKNGEYLCQSMTWGFSMNDKYIYNARSETVLEKSFFSSVYHRRCLVPVSGFYEWNRGNDCFRYEMDKPFYLAGFYKNNCFCVITTKANSNVKHIHHRMPLVLTGDDIKKWLSDEFKDVINVKDYYFHIESRN